MAPTSPDYACFKLQPAGAAGIEVSWNLLGRHNALNAVAAMAGAHALGVEPAVAGAALSQFRGVLRRMQQIGSRRGITLYDDFAHHPTAIQVTLDALRRHVGSARIIAVMEPRSNTMKLGVHAKELAPSLQAADLALILRPPNLKWDLDQALAGAGTRCEILDRVDDIISRVAGFCRAGDHVVIMSNGGFGGIHQRLLEALH
jgi:UDP-N-acetylmuramate: L-alanyl-gamma-D-glutamyl-meso-diaminopimelate ligase